MTKSRKTRQELLEEMESLRSRLEETEETLRAIRTGEVDALVVSTGEGDRVFTVTGADYPYRVMVEAMNEGAAIINSDGTIYYCNQRLADMVHEPLEKVIGASVFQYISPQDMPLFNRNFRQGAEDNRKMELNIRTADGHLSPALLSLSFLHAAGAPGSVVMIVADLALQKRSEEILAAQKSLKERTSQLEAVNKELESFSYSVSHDLHAPLRAIKGFTGMILRDTERKMDAETMRRLVVIRESTEKMERLIDDLLTLSRTSLHTMSSMPIDMDALVKATWSDCRINDPEKPMTLKAKDIPPTVGDPTLIRQLLANLLSNAVKYSSKRGTVEVEVGGHREEEGNIYYVKDHGAGFDMKYYDKLFGVFQRLHNSAEFEGTGVGLSIAQRIIHRHGGRIWAEGKEGEGAVFYFMLPHEKK